MTLAFIGIWELLIIGLIVPISLAGLAFWVWMLVDCIQNTRLDPNEKIMWVVVIALTHFIGALIYLLIGRNRQRA